MRKLCAELGHLLSSAVDILANVQLRRCASPFCKANSGCTCWKLETLCKEGQLKEAIHIFEHLKLEGEICHKAYAVLFHGCIKLKALAEATQVHNHFRKCRVNSSIYLKSILINMYSKCGSIENARQVFNEMADTDLYSWAALIAGSVQSGKEEEAVTLFEHMQQNQMEPDRVTLLSVVKACANIASKEFGKRLHAFVIKYRHMSDLCISGTLINMYARCGMMDDAQQVFDSMPMRDVVSWNTMILGYGQYESENKVFIFFRRMQQEGLEPNKVSFLNIMLACTSIEWGKLVHSCFEQMGFGSDMTVSTAAIHMYVKGGSIHDAYFIFKHLAKPNTVSWNAMLAGFVQTDKAINMFAKMENEGVKADKETFNILLNACGNRSCLAEGKWINAYILKSACELELSTGSALLDMYGKCGCMQDACQVFSCIPVLDIVAWNSMIACYIQHPNLVATKKLLKQMRDEGMKPNKITFINVLGVCACAPGKDALDLGRKVHINIVETGQELDIFVASSLIKMYAKCGNLCNARQLFDEMMVKNVVSWTVMISSYVDAQLETLALELFWKMGQDIVEPNDFTFVKALSACAGMPSQEQGKLIHACILKSRYEVGKFVGSSIIHMYAECGCTKEACQLFERLPKECPASWNSLIAAYLKCGDGVEALNIFKDMRNRYIKPNEVTFINVLIACNEERALEWGKLVHANILKAECVSDVFVGTTLIDMYIKCGSLGESHKVFNRMSSKDVAPWTAMVSGYAHKKNSLEALKLFRLMKQSGLEPNQATYVSILSSCACAGSIEQANQVHASVRKLGQKLDISMENAIVDMYANCGNIEDARQVFDKMVVKNVKSWNIMIGGYAQHGNAKESLNLFKTMHQQGIEPNAVTVLAVLSACNFAGLADEGYHYFLVNLSINHSLVLHYHACVVDLLGHTGCLIEAKDLTSSMIVEPSLEIWTSLLAGYDRCMYFSPL